MTLGPYDLDHIYHADALDFMRALPDDSVDLVATDPPYMNVKNEAWDRQWRDVGEYIAWVGQLCAQWRRVLKPNGSLYVFASPQNAARVEMEVGRWFNVLNNIRWVKDEGWHHKTRKEEIRGYLSNWESIIFAEHYGADNAAKGEAGYGAACDQLRGFVFEPLRAYLDGERDRAGIPNAVINDAWCEWKGVNSTSQTQKWFSTSCFNPPTFEAYHWLRDLFSRLNHGGEYLCRGYDDIRREYEDLRREYEYLRRPFNASPDAPYTDVWQFPTVQAYPGKHPCEKPIALMMHIIQLSSRPGAVVLDPFMGSGRTAVAASMLGRRFIGCDADAGWARRAQLAVAQAPLFVPEPAQEAQPVAVQESLL